MALLSMRADKFWKRTVKKINIQGSDVAGFDKSKVEYFNCHKMGHFARECRAPRRLLKASKNLDHLIESQRSDQVKEGVGYNVVPPPAADLYLSPKKDLSWTGLPEFVDDTVTDYSRPSPTIASTSAEGQIKDSSTSEDVASPNPPKHFVKFIKPKDSQPESKIKEQETLKKPQVKYDEQRRVQRETTRSQNHTYKSPSHRSGGHRPHGASMRPSYRPAGHRPHGPTMNPRRPTMNGARTNKSFFNQAPSYETRPFLKSSVVRTQYRAP
nr:ribonuclease H-like domain-containing protein [Tanacetum cinerariifolium]